MQRKEITVLLLIFSLAVAVTALFWAVLPAEFRENESTDYTLVYEPVARNILAGRGIVDDEGQLATRYPPGFSILLAGVFGLAGMIGLSDALAIHAFRFVCGGCRPSSSMSWRGWSGRAISRCWRLLPG